MAHEHETNKAAAERKADAAEAKADAKEAADLKKANPRAFGVKTPGTPEGCPCVGDVVTLKSGGPSMTVIGVDTALALPGSPATDPEVTPERKAAGQTSIPAPVLGTVLCQWFTGAGECKEQRFQISALALEGEHAKPWTPSK